MRLKVFHSQGYERYTGASSLDVTKGRAVMTDVSVPF